MLAPRPLDNAARKDRRREARRAEKQEDERLRLEAEEREEYSGLTEEEYSTRQCDSGGPCGGFGGYVGATTTTTAGLRAMMTGTATTSAIPTGGGGEASSSAQAVEIAPAWREQLRGLLENWFTQPYILPRISIAGNGRPARLGSCHRHCCMCRRRCQNVAVLRVRGEEEQAGVFRGDGGSHVA